MVNKYHTNNPFELAAVIGIIVIISDTLDKKIKGFYQFYKRNRIIYINKELPYNKQLEVCAHELGHAVLHTRLNVMFLEHNTYFVKNKFENDANNFAAELLISDNIITQYENLTLEQIAAAEQINTELLRLKFNKRI